MTDYKLVFEDTFKLNGKPDSSIWTHEIGEKWANNESQCYVDDLSNCYVKDGILNIVATIHDQEKCKYRSARINTLGKKQFQYGKFVIRAKMPKGKGSWPAIWFLGKSKLERVRWPLCGEIDLVEFAGNRMGFVSCAIHTEAYNHKINTDKGARIKLLDASEAFHDYILEWTPDFLSFAVDENEFLRVNKEIGDGVEQWPFDQEFYMILNLAVGGWYGGQIDDQGLPYHLQISSIKVFEPIK